MNLVDTFGFFWGGRGGGNLSACQFITEFSRLFGKVDFYGSMRKIQMF